MGHRTKEDYVKSPDAREMVAKNAAGLSQND